MMGGHDRLPVVIVGGLHSEARREVVRGLLDTVPSSVALHHDLGTAPSGTVTRTIRDHSGELGRGEAPLVNDCACCALREDLVPELERLAGDGLTRLAVVELWDSVEPQAMADVVAAHGAPALQLTGVVTAVDPALVLPYLGNGDDLAEAGLAAAASDQRTVADTWARQLEYASVVAVTESPEADEEDRALLAQLHPTGQQVPPGRPNWPGSSSPGSTSRRRAPPSTRPVPGCRRRRRRPGSAPSYGTAIGRSIRSGCSTPWRTCAAPRPAAGGGSGSPTGPTPCCPGTRRAAPSASTTAGPGCTHCPTPPGSWCRPSGARRPPWTGTRNTATAASTSCSPPPPSTARD